MSLHWFKIHMGGWEMRSLLETQIAKNKACQSTGVRYKIVEGLGDTGVWHLMDLRVLFSV